MEDQSFTLTLKKCFGTTSVIDGNTVKVFVISTHLSRRSKESGHKFTAFGSSADKTGFNLNINGGPQKGGVLYQAKIPFASFKNNKLVFQGKANSIKRENNKVVKSLVPIEIDANCSSH